jgi:hypothetical protein
VIDEPLFRFWERIFPLLFGFFNVLLGCSLHGDGDDDDDDRAFVSHYRLPATADRIFGMFWLPRLVLCVHSACGLVCPRFGSLAKFVENL